MPHYKIRGCSIFKDGTRYRSGGVIALESDEETKKYVASKLIRTDQPVTTQSAPVTVAEAKNQESQDAIQPDIQVASESAMEEEDVSLVLSVIGRLDDDEDTHWTQQGLPDLRTLTEFAGKRVTRAMVNEVAPERIRRTN